MITCDVLVIGGGISGIGCATMAAEHASVIVLEAEAAAGYHSTSRSAAIFIPSYGGPEIRSLTSASESFFEEPPDELGIDTLLEPRGEMLLACEGEEETMSALMTACPGLRELPIADALRLVPILRAEPITRACLEPAARDIDVDRLLQAWSKLLRRRGGRVEPNAAARAVSRRNGLWRVDTATHVYEAGILVNAAGAWADEVARLAGVTPAGLTPCRRSAAVLPAPGGHDVGRWPLFGSVTEAWYAKPLSGKLMVSPADEDPVAPHDTFADDMVIAEGLHRYEQAVTTPVTRVERTWAGLRTFAPDRIPVAGFDPDASGFFWLAGQGGYGIQIAPALCSLAARILAGEILKPAEAALARSLSPRRFC